ncbi:Hypothetical predicted protein [Olea europaea subsp. europaea]|uniref:Uncharacterized protein n=1 Tax=Olea europaea subsp. europaea TaxID=158383 RepID=A0A8S0UK15_OLEEU|nr:Hypothetical predicted protein [Olea europaea subsp. europaea]
MSNQLKDDLKAASIIVPLFLKEINIDLDTDNLAIERNTKTTKQAVLIPMNKALEANDEKPLPLYQKALCGLTSGAIGATVGSPTDLALLLVREFWHRGKMLALLWSAMAPNMGMLASYPHYITRATQALVTPGASGPGKGVLLYEQIVEFCRDSLGFGEATTLLGPVQKALKSGGPFKFYTGFPVHCMTWIFWNQIQKLEKYAGL